LDLEVGTDNRPVSSVRRFRSVLSTHLVRTGPLSCPTYQEEGCGNST